MNIKQQLWPFRNAALLVVALFALFAGQMAYAQVPLMINYQGKMQMAGTPYNGVGYFKFALIDDPNAPTTNYWTNDASTVAAGAEPTAAVTLPVNMGLFSVRLGNAGLTNMSSLSAAAFSNSTLYLRVWFSADGVAFEQLSPDRQLVSVPFAMQAESAASVTGTDGVTGGNIKDGSITNADIDAAAAIDAAKINTTSASNLVSHLVAGTGISLLPASGVGDVTISVSGAGSAADVVCTNCVDSTDITDGTVTTTDLGFDTATQAELDAHKAGSDHDGRYYTKTQIGTASPGSNMVNWSNLGSVPAGFADGVDNTGSGTVTSVATGSGLTGGPITNTGTVSIATGGVTSTMIGDGQIANADVSASAAISGSKVNPNFGSQTLAAGNASFSALSATSVTATTTMGMPAAVAPVLSTNGQVALETDADAVNIKAGSAAVGGVPANTNVAMPLIQQKGITLLEPDQIQLLSDAIPFITVDSYNYPHGITITAIRLATSQASSLAINVENWTSPTDGAPVTIDNIATSAGTEKTETVITSPVVAAGSYIFLDLDTTNVNWAKVTIWYYVND